jgi:hypothetical protein
MGVPPTARLKRGQGFVRNQELQFYQPENAVCRGGLLIIEGRREKKRNPNYRAGGKGWQNRELVRVYRLF